MKSIILLLCAFIICLNAGCEHQSADSCDDHNSSLYTQSSFPIGSAVSVILLETDSVYRRIALQQFNSLTPENALKADALHPQENTFVWDNADRLAEFCRTKAKRLHAHTLIWHQQLPYWIVNYQGNVSDWDKMMKTHIQTIVQHFKGKATAWDVVNEAFNDDGTLRNSIWRQKLGDSYIEKAFRYAHEADPDALLFYNDYALEFNPAKRQAVLALMNSLRARGIRVDGIGLQMHINILYPAASQIVDAMAEVAHHGYKVHVSEMDVSLNPFGNNIQINQDLLQQQAEIFAAVAHHYKQLPSQYQYGITFWGIGDADSWIRSYYNRLDYPLLYDDTYHPKPAYCALKEIL